MTKKQTKTDNNKKNGSAQKSAKKSSDGVAIKAIGGLIAAIAAVLLGSRPFTGTRDDSSQAFAAALDIVFANPHTADVYLFQMPTNEGDVPKKLAELKPGDRTSLQVRTGQTVYFSTSKSGSKKSHMIDVDSSWTNFEFNAKCRDLAESTRCQGFQQAGACVTHPGWMSTQCASTCHMCHLLDPKVRCNPSRLNVSRVPAVGPGDIEKMFTSLPERYPNHAVKILSREPEGPWIATLENFVTERESSTLISTTAAGMRRSTDQGEMDSESGIQRQITSQSRTSSNSWCGVNCEDQPAVRNLIRRISEMVGVQENNFESPQVLKYAVGQYYRAHHDSTESDLQMFSGPRVYTVFLYFDEVEEGGGTSFPQMNITVAPAKGKVLLWATMKNDDPKKLDVRTSHAAEPVIRGTKHSANVRVHQYNYKVPNLWGCTGSIEGVFGENR